MSKISVLDCTLRDGGYCNTWRFGQRNIKKIIAGLAESDIDIIECGFLTQKTEYDTDVSKFNTLEQIKNVLPKDRLGKLYVAMINYGEYQISDFPECDMSSVQGIRLAFHKNNCSDALSLCKKIKEKGYQVFVQPMVSMNYSDEEFIELIRCTNELNPYAFYIVDSFGSMQKKELLRLFYIVEHNLDSQIRIGFHSHNNMQLAFSNAQALINVRGNRELILDSSVYGMGRGAGNLNTELLVEYLNTYADSEYQIKPLLHIIDEILNNFYKQNYWGYSLPNYISAKYNSHPNYAGYLADKNTLTVEDMDSIFEMMEQEKRAEFDKNYIETLYIKYMERESVQNHHLKELMNRLEGKKVLLIAPGRSSVEEKDKIMRFCEENDVVTVSVNFEYPYCRTDYKFISNIRRFAALENTTLDNCIITSNITAANIFLQTDYKSLLNEKDAVRDNAGLMCLRFLMDLGVKHLYLAGFDGYSHESTLNYAQKNLEMITRNAVLDAMNVGMNEILEQYRKEAEINFLTHPRKIV